MGMVIRRCDIYLVDLDPTIGREIRKARPCLVVSPDEMNRYLDTFVVAPLTSKGHPYPFRVECRFQGKTGQVALDQIRTVDRLRIVKRMGRLERSTCLLVLNKLMEMFDPSTNGLI